MSVKGMWRQLARGEQAMETRHTKVRQCTVRFFCPPRRPDGNGVHASVAAAEEPEHDVTSLERSLVLWPIPDPVFHLVFVMDSRAPTPS